MGLLCYLLFYPVALAGGEARCASTHMVCPTNKFHEIRTE